MNKLLIIFFSVLTFIMLYNEAGHYFYNIVYFSSFLIQVFSIIQIFSNPNRPYSLKKTFYLFSFFFFGIAPFLQYNKQVSINGSRILSENEYFLMNTLILLIFFLFEFFYFLFYKYNFTSKIDSFSQSFTLNQKHSFSTDFFALLLAFSSFGIIFYANDFNFFSLIIRGGEYSKSTVENLGASLILQRLVRPIPMMVFLFYLLLPKKNKLILTLLFLVTLITSSPLGMARFAVAAYYIPLLLVAFPFFRRKNVFSITLITSLLLIFPFLNKFRYFTSATEVKFGFDFDMFTQGHFDSYQNFALIVFNDIVTWGRQFLGVIFFWVPRSNWPNKPIGSGHYLSQLGYIDFPNASANFFAEGFINFSYPGLFIFVLGFAFFTAIFDKTYWKNELNETNSYFKVLYYLLIGMTIFILRGDLMAGFSYTLAFAFSIYIVHKILSTKRT